MVWPRPPRKLAFSFFKKQYIYIYCNFSSSLIKAYLLLSNEGTFHSTIYSSFLVITIYLFLCNAYSMNWKSPNILIRKTKSLRFKKKTTSRRQRRRRRKRKFWSKAEQWWVKRALKRVTLKLNLSFWAGFWTGLNTWRLAQILRNLNFVWAVLVGLNFVVAKCLFVYLFYFLFFVLKNSIWYLNMDRVFL